MILNNSALCISIGSVTAGISIFLTDTPLLSSVGIVDTFTVGRVYGMYSVLIILNN